MSSADPPSSSRRKRTLSELSSSPPPVPGAFPPTNIEPKPKRGKVCGEFDVEAQAQADYGLGGGRDPSASPRLSSQEKGKSRAMSPEPGVPSPSELQMEIDMDTQKQDENQEQRDEQEENPERVKADALVDDLQDELTCGMCAGLYVEPLCLTPCGHAFCGSCVKLWLASFQLNPALSYSNPSVSLMTTLQTLRERERYGDPGPSVGGVNGMGARQAVPYAPATGGAGDALVGGEPREGGVIGGGVEAVRPTPEKGLGCPQCRDIVTGGEGSGVVKGLVEVLLRHRPEIARPADEILKANSIYKKGDLLSFPQPARVRPNQLVDHHGRPVRANPDGTLNARGYWRPCPFCKPPGAANAGALARYVCPVPIPDATDPAQFARALSSDGACPDGHMMCSVCDQLCPEGIAQKCDGCSISACGNRHGCVIPKVSELRLSRGEFGVIDHLTGAANTFQARSWQSSLIAFHFNHTELAYFIAFVQKQSMRVQAAQAARLELVREPEVVQMGVERNAMDGIAQAIPAGAMFDLPVVAAEQAVAAQPQVGLGDSGNALREEPFPAEAMMEVDVGRPVEGQPIVTDQQQGQIVDQDGDVNMEAEGGAAPEVEPAPATDHIMQSNTNGLPADNAPTADAVNALAAPLESRITANRIFNDIMDWLITPESLDSGGLIGLFDRATRGSSVSGMVPERLCKDCGDDLIGAGIMEWWMREMKKPSVREKMPEDIREREPCKSGISCEYQKVFQHSQTYSHLSEAMSEEEQQTKGHQVAPETGNPGGSDIDHLATCLATARAIFDLPPPPPVVAHVPGANVNGNPYPDSEAGSEDSEENRAERNNGQGQPEDQALLPDMALPHAHLHSHANAPADQGAPEPGDMSMESEERDHDDDESEDGDAPEYVNKGVQTDPATALSAMVDVAVQVDIQEQMEMDRVPSVPAPSGNTNASHGMRTVRASTPLLSEVFGNRRSSPARFTSPSAEGKPSSPRHVEYFNPSSQPGSPRLVAGGSGSGQMRGLWDDME